MSANLCHPMGDIKLLTLLIVGWFLGILTRVFGEMAWDRFQDWREHQRLRARLDARRHEKKSDWVELNGVLYGFSARHGMVRASELSEEDVKLLGGMPQTRMNIP